MISIKITILSLFLCSASISASSSSTSKLQEVTAVKVSKSSKKATFASSADTKPPVHDNSHDLERTMMESRVVLEGMQQEKLSAVEAFYYEDCLKDAVEMAQQDQEDNRQHVTLRSVIVEDDDESKNKDENRKLRGTSNYQEQRSLLFNWSGWSFSFMQIFAIAEFYSCNFCGGYDDDDDFHRHRVQPEDDDFDRHFYVHGTPGPRHLLSTNGNRVEDLLCQCLRNGPFDSFHPITKCTLELVEWGK